MKGVIVAFASAALAGCQTFGMSVEELRAMDTETCIDAGAVPGTRPFLDCRIALMEMHAAESRALANSISTPVQIPAPQQASAPQIISCRTSGGGYYQTTTCF